MEAIFSNVAGALATGGKAELSASPEGAEKVSPVPVARCEFVGMDHGGIRYKQTEPLSRMASWLSFVW